MIWASGIVRNSLHVLVSPSANGAATYAWCDSKFAIAGSMPLRVTDFPKAVAIKILQLGDETGIVFSDGSVLAFSTPA